MKEKTAAITNLTPPGTSCSGCPAFKACVAARLCGHDTALLGRVVTRRRLRRKGEMLYCVGDPLRTLHVVQAGSIRTGMSTCEGDVQVLGFHVPGDILGIDAIGENSHPSDATAIEASVVCELPYPLLEKQMRATPPLQREFMRLLSGEIAREKELMCVLGQRNADSRLATCLLNLSERYGRADTRAGRLTLAMSRQDLGNHLGLAMETISRLFTRFQEEGLLSVAGRRVQLLDYPRLRAL